jgi:betaine-aldehyde dehydrogenase
MSTRDVILIDGEWRRPRTTEATAVICPSTEEVVGTVPDVGRDDIDDAVRAARRSFDGGSWPRLNAGERAAILEDALHRLEPHVDEIAELVTTEMGVPISIARQ